MAAQNDVEKFIEEFIYAVYGVVCAATGGAICATLGAGTLGVGCVIGGAVSTACFFGSTETVIPIIKNNFRAFSSLPGMKSVRELIRGIYIAQYRKEPSSKTLDEIEKAAEWAKSVNSIKSVVLAEKFNPELIAAAEAERLHKLAVAEQAKRDALVREQQKIARQQLVLQQENQKRLPVFIGLGVLAVAATAFVVMRRK